MAIHPPVGSKQKLTKDHVTYLPQYEDYYSILLDFKRNGISSDLDEMDMMQIRARSISKAKQAGPGPEDMKFQENLELIRCELLKLRPLSGKKLCKFCKNNKEQEAVYSTHVVKDDVGRVICPILFKYTCPVCFATGSSAHTIKYCPYNDGREGIVDALLQSPRDCAGRHRRHDTSNNKKEHGSQPYPAVL